MLNSRAKLRNRQVSNRIRRSRLETLERRQLLAADIPDFVGDGQIGLVGTAQVSDTWETINLTQTFVNPVVIAGPPSQNDGSPATVRVRNVNSNSFEISVDEWDYLDGTHATETVSYLVVEGGTHRLTDGTRLVAGYLTDQTHTWTSFSTDDLFSSRPVLLSQIMTDNDAAAATTRANVSSNNDFQIRIQEEEAADDIHGAETVGFILIDSGVGSTGDQDFQAFITSPIITHQDFDRSINGAGFDTAPAFFANMQTINGTDPSTVGLTALSNTTATIFINEEQSGDTEVAHWSAEVVGGLAIEPGGIFASTTVVASDRFDALEAHILGTDTMTFAELKTWSNTFDNESGSLGNRINDFVAAVEVVELYETEKGPLFTSQGISSFDNDWPTSNDSRGLERAIFRVYQAIFDATNANLIREFPDVVDTVMFKSTQNFPGTVAPPTDPNAVYQVRIDGSLAAQFGSPGGYESNEARRMTGAYLAPGSIAEVIVPQALVNAGYKIRVGGHSWDLSNKNSANRLHRVSNQFNITSTVTQVANPMGGNIYIEVPVGADAGIVDVQFRNTVRAPFFSDRGFDETSASEWNTERAYPGAFTDIESEYSMWTVPSKWVRTMSHAQIMAIIEAHDAMIQTASVAAGRDADRTKAILYMIVDTQIRGTAFSIGYPQSNYGNFSSSTVKAPLTVANATAGNGDSVLLHEHGHAELLTMFNGEPEAQVHMLATAVGHKVEGRTLQRAFAGSMAFGNTFNHTTSDILNSWVVMDQFLSNQDMVRAQAAYRPRGHADYVEYVELFGWEAYENFHRTLNNEADGKDWSELGIIRTNHNANDRILRLSREAGVNVAPLFKLWGHSPSNRSQLDTAMANEGLEPSVGIYDRLIEARNSVPQTQAQWNAVDNKVRAYYFSGEPLWDTLRNTNNGNTGYEASAYNGVERRTAAVARIDAIIASYFPGGRPEVVDRNTTPNVVLFEGINFHGQTLELPEGRYANVDLDASLVRNNEASSISIPEGFVVTVYNFQFSDDQATYTSSTADLASFDNRTSSVVVTRATIDGLSVDIGGTIAGTQYDQLITNAGTLDGTLTVSLTDSFVPSAADTFTLVVSSTNLAGEFGNVESGQRITTVGGEGTFLVTYDASSSTVVLSDYAVVSVASTIVNRGLAYRGASAIYGEGMVDPNKSALHGPGAAASMANYTNYSQGINRVVVDIDNLPATTLTESDFQFRVGNTEDFGNSLAWTSTSPSAINVAALAGTTKRVTIDWPHQTIMNQWLEVTVKANANTGLTQDDVFYFGNQVGDVDGSTSPSKHVTVNAFDTLDVRFHQSPSSNSVGIDNIYDIDRNGSVNAFDTLDVRFSQMPSGGLMMITLPPAAAPEATAAAPEAAPPAASSVAVQNPNNALDVNGDGQVTALDALIGINFLGQTAASSELWGFSERQSSAFFYDVSGDGQVTALDSLQIINKLGRSSSQQAEMSAIDQQDSLSDRDDELDWVSDRTLQQDSIFDLALSTWNKKE
ncbi:Dockerin type I repeat protein [Rubripirellula tenax]|uniref:Dockerin type I repeat protein n=1 Tax=Rubripirellula tenax TaxID=2528015 RepID=A0A5C6F798_9BACT|nr:M60 family peptidase N-terminal accessory domain-containing protein [Rubripirellula tenax]TWU57095.1 Dockerin type I repeat protein [Rubripirellula tenax]